MGWGGGWGREPVDEDEREGLTQAAPSAATEDAPVICGFGVAPRPRVQPQPRWRAVISPAGAVTESRVEGEEKRPVGQGRP